VVNDLLTLPLAERLELVQSLWDSIAAEQSDPEHSDADAVLDAIEQSL
jgi:putative addiction module component (TIGR02574 family)